MSEIQLQDATFEQEVLKSVGSPVVPEQPQVSVPCPDGKNPVYVWSGGSDIRRACQ